MKVLFTPTGREHFLGAFAYIRRDNTAVAKAFRLKAEKELKRLLAFSASGRLLPEFPDLPYRELIILPYRFFYLATKSAVWVVAVWHSAQLPERL